MLTECTEVYYVVPEDDPPNCIGNPCMPLDKYIENASKYFSRDKVNVSMNFLPGIHTSKYNNTLVSGLKRFKLVGTENVDGEKEVTTLCFSLVFDGFIEVSFEMVRFSDSAGCSSAKISFINTKAVVIKSVVGGARNLSPLTKKANASLNSFKQPIVILDPHCAIYPHQGSIVVSGRSCGVLTVAYSNVTIANSTFANNLNTALTTYRSTITLSGDVSFVNNTGTKGGAMALYSSTLNIQRNASVDFVNNVAREMGGAIYVPIANNPYVSDCFYQLLDYSNSSEAYRLQFLGNMARGGGDHIYGANMYSNCRVAKVTWFFWISETIHSYQAMKYFFEISPTNSLSSISSDQRGICLCDPIGRPRCADSIWDFYQTRDVTPGEMFTLPAVVVGGSFGTTTGAVYAGFLPLNGSNDDLPSLKDKFQYTQWVTDRSECTQLLYTVYSNYTDETVVLYLTSTNESPSTVRSKLGMSGELEEQIQLYTSEGVISNDLQAAPRFVYIRLLPCPKGFSLTGNPPKCNCYDIKLNADYYIGCDVRDGMGYVTWSGPIWIGLQGNETFVVNYRCISDYCKQGLKTVDLENDTDQQCSFNHASRLCGGCREGYSLAIGSSHCIHCPNNNNLSLLIFFVAAGFLLVLLISVLNLTVTQGAINGLIFYANIVWAYQGVLFHQQTHTNVVMMFEKTFIAWLNLDFGIETCFFNGLNAFWKTWLQYVFPLYTAGLFTIGLRYSSNLSKLFGDRSVPTLATLLFLSHTKLLRTIIASLELSHLTNYPSQSLLYVWSIDGRLDYGRFPHITLLLVAIACLVFLWLPYTILLFLMQWLRRLPHSTMSKWITRYKPVIDAYSAPLKDRHHYWFGVLLLARGVLLLVASLTLNIDPSVSLFLLLGVSTFLLCYVNYMQVYRKVSVLILESTFLINLVILVGGAMYYFADSESSHRITLTYVSIGVAFLKFCGMIVWSIVQALLRCRRQSSSTESQSYTSVNGEDSVTSQRDEASQEYSQFRDSILEEAPLFSKTKHPTY